MDFAIDTKARCLLVAAVVSWIGDVWFVTLVVMPGEPPVSWMAVFHQIGQDIAPPAKVRVLLASASGFWTTHQAGPWNRFVDPSCQ